MLNSIPPNIFIHQLQRAGWGGRKKKSPSALHWGQTQRVAAKGAREKPLEQKWPTDSWPAAFELLIFQFPLPLESPPLWVPAFVTVSTIRAPLLSHSNLHYGRWMRLSATGYYWREWSALCDKVTQQGWQMIFPEVWSQCVVSDMISCAIFKAGLINESYN